MKYNNPTKAAGVHVTEAAPLDDRSILLSEEDTAALSGVEPMPSVMYDGMVVTFADTRRKFIWVESLYGLMAVGFTYPEWADDISGHNYAGKTYNLVLFDDYATYTAVYAVGNSSGSVQVPFGKLTYRQLQDMENITNITVTSSLTGHTETEIPDSWSVGAAGNLDIIFTPPPVIGEVFKITIH
jgi:hypothetical protein